MQCRKMIFRYNISTELVLRWSYLEITRKFIWLYQTLSSINWFPLLSLYLLENKICHRSVCYSKCNPNQEGSSQAKQSFESIIQQRFFNTNGLTPQRTGSTQSEWYTQTPHCQICSHATKQQTPNIFKNFFYCKPNCTPTQYQTKSQSPH